MTRPNLMSAGIFARVIATQEFAIGLLQLGTDGSNASPSSCARGAQRRPVDPLAHPLEAQLVVWRGRDVVEDFDPRHFERGRQQIVGQGGVDELALLVERQPLVEGVADPLGNAALDLAGDDQRIDHRAAIMHHHGVVKFTFQAPRMVAACPERLGLPKSRIPAYFSP